ncbi:MAG: hypothetical protein KKD63_04480 [Proteobacteria bacterium]|nr:hypothetical protein [Pseudomonadota bacterium]
MPKKRYRQEDILTKLREEDMAVISQGETIANATRTLGVSEVLSGRSYSDKKQVLLR